MAAHNELGKWGEEVAASFLRERGYEIVERDWKSGHRDIDIIATDGTELVFVEVKTRRNRLFGEPEEAVDYRKRRSLQAAVNHYISYRKVSAPVRIDIITVVGLPGTEPQIHHLKDVAIY